MPELHDILEREAASYAPPPDLLERVRERGRQRERNRRAGTTLVALLVIAVGIVSLPRMLPQPSVVLEQPPDPLVGTWASVDADGSSQTMEIRAVDGGRYAIVVNDEAATVCSGVPATMTGTGQLDGAGLVIAAPVLECDDGSTPVPVDGSSLEDAVRDYTVVYDAETATLTDSFGVEWHRPSATPDDVTVEADPRDVFWPQSSLEEAREAQRRADAGDPAYTWQVDGALDNGERPSDAAIFARFLTEELGWDGFRCCEERNWGESMHWTGDGIRVVKADFIRCAGGASNTLYPDDPDGRTCAPTRGDGGYERVRVTAHQPVDDGPKGIWVIQGSHPQPPFHQVAPLSDAEIADAVEPFLQARVDGKGAGERVGSNPTRIPLLYATSDGARYERFDYEVVDGPIWPFGIVYLNVRLFADGGETVVEQPFRLEEDSQVVVQPAPPHRLFVLEYASGDTPTTENGAPVPEPYSLFGGRVTFAADQSWEDVFFGPHGPDVIGLYRSNKHDQLFTVVGDPVAPTGTCDVGDQSPSADALVRSVRSRPNLSVSEPRPTRVGSIDAVALDVTAGDHGEGCEAPPGAYEQPEDGPAVLAPRAGPNHPERRLWWGVGSDNRARLYVFELPGNPARTVAILVMAPKPDFDSVLDAAQPILDSFEFRAP